MGENKKADVDRWGGGEKGAGNKCGWLTWCNEKKTGKEEKIGEEKKATHSLDWDISLPNYALPFPALKAISPRFWVPTFEWGELELETPPSSRKAVLAIVFLSFLIHQPEPIRGPRALTYDWLYSHFLLNSPTSPSRYFMKHTQWRQLILVPWPSAEAKWQQWMTQVISLPKASRAQHTPPYLPSFVPLVLPGALKILLLCICSGWSDGELHTALLRVSRTNNSTPIWAVSVFTVSRDLSHAWQNFKLEAVGLTQEYSRIMKE